MTKLFLNRPLDCTKCNYAHIVTSAPALSKNTRSPKVLAEDALEEARGMTLGAQRSEALKKGGTPPNKFRKLSLISCNGQIEVPNSLLGAVVREKPLLKERD